MTLDDFPDDVRSGKYETVERPYLRDDFWPNFHKWLETQGVPAKYCSKVASHAWREGHSCGYHEVVNCAYDLIEIFDEE